MGSDGERTSASQPASASENAIGPGEQGTMLITGAARRIGRALALYFAGQGWRVAVHYNSSADDAHATVRDIQQAGGEAAAIACDLADANALSGLVAACSQTLGPPNCLINNASDFKFDTICDLTPETWAHHIDINLRAPILLSQAVAAGLPERRTGTIVNIIDQRVWNLTPEFFSYTVSKAGLWSATRMLAQALAPQWRVNAIGPGPVLKSIHQSDSEFQAEASNTPLGRAAEPAEIARAISFILDASAMTGQMIALDSGQHLSWTPDETPVSRRVGATVAHGR